MKHFNIFERSHTSVTPETKQQPLSVVKRVVKDGMEKVGWYRLTAAVETLQTVTDDAKTLRKSQLANEHKPLVYTESAPQGSVLLKVWQFQFRPSGFRKLGNINGTDIHVAIRLNEEGEVAVDAIYFDPNDSYDDQGVFLQYPSASPDAQPMKRSEAIRYIDAAAEHLRAHPSDVHAVEDAAAA